MNKPNEKMQTIVNKSWNPAENRYDYSFTFTFHTREEYLAFRHEWRAHYAALSETLRSQKSQIRTMQQRGELAAPLQSQLHQLKLDATVQLLMRHASRAEAGRQYRAARLTAP